MPTFGFWAGPWCDGQVLVYHDVLGREDRVVSTFVRRHAELKAAGIEALAPLPADVCNRALPERRRELPPAVR